MLTRFTVGNFKSFDKPQTLSLVAGQIQKNKERLFSASDMKILKFAALFGANASGKSNFIKAIEFARNVIVLPELGNPYFEDQRYSYFRLNPNNKEKSSYFEFEICIDGEIYAYGFRIILSKKQITEEWLIKLNKDKDEDIFTRNVETNRYFFNEAYLSEPLDTHMKIYLEDFKSVTDRLFLSNIVSNKNALYLNNPKLQILPRIFSWILNLHISYPNTPITGYDCFSQKNIDLLLDALSSFRTGISKVNKKDITKEQAFAGANTEFIKQTEFLIQNIVERNKAAQENKNTKVKVQEGLRFNCNGRLVFVSADKDAVKYTEITFEHFNVKGVEFSLAEESEGTQRLLDLMSLLFNTDKNRNYIFVIDELDRSLHPQLTMHFIKTYLNLAKEENIQLIISTHESHLFNLDILRQDEIFLVEINNENASILYPFDRFKERFDKKTEKAYLDGRYGGVPIFDNIFSPLDEGNKD